MAKLERHLEIKTEAYLTSLKQYELVLEQRDIIAKNNREMYAQIKTKIDSYKASRTLLEENTNALISGPKPSWIKYGLGYEEMNKQIICSNTQPKLIPCDQGVFIGNNEDQEEVVTCSPNAIATSFSNTPSNVKSSLDLIDLNAEFDFVVENSVKEPIVESINSEDATSKKSDNSGSKYDDKRTISYVPIGKSKT